LQRCSEHRLPYKQYLRARELGIVLPEAAPTFQVGLLGTCDLPDPVKLATPDDWPLARCYRLDPVHAGDADSDDANVHLLAALGKFTKPFIPVDIRSIYDGYSWAKLPTIGKVEVQVGKNLHSDYVWSGKLTCVEELRITVHTSDGRVFSSPVCMAIAPPPDDESRCLEEHVLIAPDAERQLAASEIWYHLGGWCDEGDTYDTQERQFEEELDHFWANLHGPDEHLRQQVHGLLRVHLRSSWKQVTAYADGRLEIQHEDGTSRKFTPPRG
jgi:hypothetical protein